MKTLGEQFRANLALLRDAKQDGPIVYRTVHASVVRDLTFALNAALQHPQNQHPKTQQRLRGLLRAVKAHRIDPGWLPKESKL